MSNPGLKKLIIEFADVETLPVEVETIRRAIIRLRFQDEIYIDGRPADVGTIRGVFCQFTTHSAPYAVPTLCTVIGYNTNDSIEWQRVSCCKEMVHIFDDPVEKTKSADELEGLVVKLLGPMSTDDIGRADIMAMKDKFALYQCLPLLLPDAARAVCLELLADGKTTKEKIAKLACIPQQLCDRMLGDDWPKLLESLLDC